jgi:hypothetical protein
MLFSPSFFLPGFSPGFSMDMIFLLAAVAIVLLIVATALLPRTTSVRVKGRVEAPASHVFRMLTDLPEAGRWIPNFIAADRVAGKDGPARRHRITHKEDGRLVESLQQVTSWMPGKQYGWKHVEDVVGGKVQRRFDEQRTVLTLLEQSGETEIEIVGEWTAGGFLNRWPARFSRPKRVQAHFENILDLLRQNVRMQ